MARSARLQNCRSPTPAGAQALRKEVMRVAELAVVMLLLLLILREIR